MQDPNRKGVGFLTRVQIHESVFHRIHAGDDRYAPTGLPPDYEIVHADGTVTAKPEASSPAPQRPGRQQWVWNDVWRRRVNYFMIVGVSLALALLPLIQAGWPPSACEGPQCLLSPVISGVGEVLPGVAQPWIRAFAHAPGWFLIGAVLIVLLMSRSGNLQRRIEDGMRELWAQALGLPLGPGRPTTAAGRSTEPPDDWIYRLRSNSAYQGFFQFFKWRLVPGLFGGTLLIGSIAAGLLILLLIGYRMNLSAAERSGRICAIGAEPAAAQGQPQPVADRSYSTSSLCWPIGFPVVKNRRYRLEIVVTKPWQDGRIPATPAGFGNEQMRWFVRYPAVLVRRSLTDRWFQPVLRIARPNGRVHLQALDMRCACGTGGHSASDSNRSVYTVDFTAEASGNLSLFINDGVIDLAGLTSRFYANNRGEAMVRIEGIDPKADRTLPDPNRAGDR